MLQLADRLTVPQIFFNAVHIGGAAELKALEASGELQAQIDLMQSGPEPDDPRLSVPDYPPAPAPEEIKIEEHVTCIGAECLGHSDVAAMLQSILDIRDRKARRNGIMRTDAKCFVGSEAVDAILAKYPGNVQNRSEAVQVLCGLEQSGFFEHVACAHPFKDEAGLLYRLQSDAATSVLNSFRA
jgi:hypothetical protein